MSAVILTHPTALHEAAAAAADVVAQRAARERLTRLRPLLAELDEHDDEWKELHADRQIAVQFQEPGNWLVEINRKLGAIRRRRREIWEEIGTIATTPDSVYVPEPLTPR